MLQRSVAKTGGELKLKEAIKKLEYLHKAWSDPLSGWTNDGRSEMSATLLPILKNHETELRAAKRETTRVWKALSESCENHETTGECLAQPLNEVFSDECKLSTCPLLAKPKKARKVKQ